MAIDSSIYFQQQAPDILGSIQNGLKVSDLMQDRKMKQEAYADDQAMKGAAKKNITYGADGAPTLNQSAYLSDIAKVNPLKAIEQKKAFAVSDRDEQVAKVKSLQDKLGITAQILGPVADQAGYEKASSQLISLGLAKHGELPAQFDPNHVKNLQMSTLSAKDQIDDHWKKLGFDQKTEELKTKHDENNIKREQMMGEKNEKRITALKDDLDPNKARGGNLAKSQAMLNSAERVEGLFAQFPDGNIPAGQTNELAAAVAGLVNGGSAQSQHQIDSLTPSSMKGDANKIAGWLTNDPRGMEQQDFMKMMRETTQREKEIAGHQVKSGQIARLSAHGKLAKADPETYASLLKAYNIDPSEIKDGKYAPAAKGNAPSTSSPAAAQAHPQAEQALMWAKQNPDTPEAAEILRRLGK